MMQYWRYWALIVLQRYGLSECFCWLIMNLLASCKPNIGEGLKFIVNSENEQISGLTFIYPYKCIKLELNMIEPSASYPPKPLGHKDLKTL